jgi:hypothetical protein
LVRDVGDGAVAYFLPIIRDEKILWEMPWQSEESDRSQTKHAAEKTPSVSSASRRARLTWHYTSARRGPCAWG